MGPEEPSQGTDQTSDGLGRTRAPEQGFPRANPEALVIDLHYEAPKRVVIRNLIIAPITPESLHGNWEFLKRGCDDIQKRIRPRESSSWIPEDVYAALRYPEASKTVGWIVSRNQKALGWACGQLLPDQYGKLEFVLWDAWSIPLRERYIDDDVDGARDQLVDYIRMWAKANGAWRIVTYSYRKLEALGWTKSHTTYYQTV